MVKIKVLLQRNKYYKENPILKKENFTAEDEIEIENFLRRVKHPLLLKYGFSKPQVNMKKPLTFAPRKTTENYCDEVDFV